MSNNLLDHNIAAGVATLQSLTELRDDMDRAAALVLDALTHGRKLLVCGNGGSAADAMHFATEFVCRFTTDRRPYPALCLNSSGGDLTAIGNDYAYEDVFSRQVWAFGEKGDVLIVFTSSGNSENIQRALAKAKEKELTSVAFLGRGGGQTKGLATVDLIVPRDEARGGGGNAARVQEAQKLLLHTLCEMVEADLPR